MPSWSMYLKSSISSMTVPHVMISGFSEMLPFPKEYVTYQIYVPICLLVLKGGHTGIPAITKSVKALYFSTLMIHMCLNTLDTYITAA